MTKIKEKLAKKSKMFLYWANTYIIFVKLLPLHTVNIL